VLESIDRVLIWAAMLLNLGVALWLLLAITIHWQVYSHWQKRFKFSLICYSFSIAFLTGEVIRRGLPITGYRYLLLTASSAFLLWVLVVNRRHYHES
jgi:hypothetical protein